MRRWTWCAPATPPASSSSSAERRRERRHPERARPLADPRVGAVVLAEAGLPDQGAHAGGELLGRIGAAVQAQAAMQEPGRRDPGRAAPVPVWKPGPRPVGGLLDRGR